MSLVPIYRVSASTTDFSIGEPSTVGEASPYTMTVQIFFPRTYELRRMVGPLPAPQDEDDVATTDPLLHPWGGGVGKK
jgi:hypothetical protein